MNRRARRAAAARARRGVRTGYEHRLLAAGAALADQLRGKVVHAICEHETWCGIYRKQGCDCVPNISFVPDGGGDAFMVGLDGSVKQQRRN